jgi:phospholipase/carboxylesterase
MNAFNRRANQLSRRVWLEKVTRAGVALGIVVGAEGALSACARVSRAKESDMFDQPADRTLGRLQTPYKPPTGKALPGESPLNLDANRDGLRYVPAGYNANVAAPLVLMLHGANGTPTSGMRPFRALADSAGFVLLAPASRAQSWDVRYGSFGPDVKFIDAALEQTFALCNIDPNRIFIAGFSDGASYSLSLGLANGALFRRVIAFSPGFFDEGALQGRPPIFISHGTRDQILNIDTSSRRLVPQLRGRGYNVTYQEFTGPHAVPPEIAAQAKDWLLAPVAAVKR